MFLKYEYLPINLNIIKSLLKLLCVIFNKETKSKLHVLHSFQILFVKKNIYLLTLII